MSRRESSLHCCDSTRRDGVNWALVIFHFVVHFPLLQILDFLLSSGVQPHVGSTYPFLFTFPVLISSVTYLFLGEQTRSILRPDVVKATKPGFSFFVFILRRSTFLVIGECVLLLC